jgi:NAD(P) transhydrogenase subunit alpha
LKHFSSIDVSNGSTLIPGKHPPQSLSAKHTYLLKSGSGVIDLAAHAGGNCPLSCLAETIVTPQGVTIVGDGNAPRHLPGDTSSLYALNLLRFFYFLGGF